MYVDNNKNAIELVPVISKQLESFIKRLLPKHKTWVKANDFKANSGDVCLIPNAKGGIEKALLGLESRADAKAFAIAATKLPQGVYSLKGRVNLEATVQWGLAQYKFNRYKAQQLSLRELVLPKAQLKEAKAIVDSVNIVRELINTPCEDLGPEALSEEMEKVAVAHNAKFVTTVGDALLKKNYPAIHAVGRASAEPPRLLELHWGDKKHPLLCLVGKGVCFDSGGLDIKPASGMRLMKKDMGGAAHVIGLANLIMSMRLPVQLKVLVPAVENAISANAYRPGDIITTRRGLTVEVGNTDAEGRLILADALARACEYKPKLIIDFATLTGAARIAVGTGIAAMFSNNHKFAGLLETFGEQKDDPVFRMPLHQPYLKHIQPSIADLSNTGTSVYGGAITAALFLQQFIEKKTPWAHFDIMAWNVSSLPGKPQGGEAMGLRASYEAIKFCFKKV
jgi:leucyl aminopeptidase